MAFVRWHHLLQQSKTICFRPLIEFQRHRCFGANEFCGWSFLLSIIGAFQRRVNSPSSYQQSVNEGERRAIAHHPSALRPISSPRVCADDFVVIIHAFTDFRSHALCVGLCFLIVETRPSRQA